jgi:RNA polymerase sigma-70 factor (sigma-E family)
VLAISREAEAVLSFDEFVAAHLGALMAFAVAVTSDRSLSEDLVQDVMLKAHEQWERVSAADDPFAYVRRMLINEHISWRRKWGRVVPVSEAHLRSIVDVAGDAPDHANTLAEREALVHRLRRLPRRQQAVLALRYFAGMPDADIAAELGCSVSAVRSYISRALTRLRDADAPVTRPNGSDPNHA